MAEAIKMYKEINYSLAIAIVVGSKCVKPIDLEGETFIHPRPVLVGT